MADERQVPAELRTDGGRSEGLAGVVMGLAVAGIGVAAAKYVVIAGVTWRGFYLLVVVGALLAAVGAFQLCTGRRLGSGRRAAPVASAQGAGIEARGEASGD